MDENDIKKIEEIFTRSIGILADVVQQKPDIVIEGQKILGKKIDDIATNMSDLEEMSSVLSYSMKLN